MSRRARALRVCRGLATSEVFVGRHLGLPPVPSFLSRARLYPTTQRHGGQRYSLAMEDLEMTPQGKADMEDAVEGRITPDELVERTRARYGLD